MQGEWTCDDLPTVLRIFASNLDAVGAMEGGPARFARLANELFTRAMRRNTLLGSRRNIALHYDLSNELFALFLDPSMTYSSGIFPSESATLEEAQREKLTRVCDKLALGPGDHLLEIGTGWGALAIHAAREYGCLVTTTTVSLEQHRMATERVRAAGLDDRITVLLRDYRELDGTYDKLVSIEMIEAVGHAYLDGFFRTCSARLAPSGQMLVQAITIADQAHAQHLGSVDFIKKYIFPGSEIPSATSMLDSATRASDLRLFHFEDLTPHYARTLRIWRERFMANADAVRGLGFDERFLRMWEYYLAYCEGGFEARYLGSVQLLMTKPGCQRGALVPSPL
jgi:cyclopropane-fatty-acyl-phospholipid synthase